MEQLPSLQIEAHLFWGASLEGTSPVCTQPEYTLTSQAKQ